MYRRGLILRFSSVRSACLQAESTETPAASTWSVEYAIALPQNDAVEFRIGNATAAGYFLAKSRPPAGPPTGANGPTLTDVVMATGRRFGSRGIVAVLSLACGSALPAAPAARPTPQAISAVADALPPIVRLRKLHLVRPDLIPYPIEYAVYC